MTGKQAGGVETKTLAAYDAVDLCAPFKVTLEDAVQIEFGADGKVVKTIIPDMAGLIHAVVVARVLHPRKLSGDELRWVRKAMGWKSKSLAKTLEMTPEHWSRCESSEKVLSKQTEKLLRVYCVFKVPDKSAIEALGFGDDLLDAIRIDGVWDPASAMEFRFFRSKPETSEQPGEDGKWRPDNQSEKQAA